jgi:hypothetical protein
MPGGLLNLASVGNQNVLFNSNPQKTYWTSTHKRYTNFGMQNFRLDYEGLRQLSPTTDTVYNFKVKRYADLLTDTFFVINVPNIYSPVFPCGCTSEDPWVPYEFKWIKNLGAMMIRTLKFSIGGAVIQSMTGHDIVALANRDLTPAQKNKWDVMVGNTPDMYDPANSFGRINTYPNAVYFAAGAEPSIRGRELHVPLPIWWSLNSQQAFPLVCLQYNELQIEIVLRPIRELYQIRDVLDVDNTYPVVAPNMNVQEHQFYRFLQTPPNPSLQYSTFGVNWFENAHLSCTYCFLSNEEAKVFSASKQHYLIKEVYDTWFQDVAVTGKAWLQNSSGMVVGWTLLFQRSDVNLRNEWSNYTNWPYDYLPFNITPCPMTLAEGNSPCSEAYQFFCGDSVIPVAEGTLGYGLNPNGSETGLYSTGAAQPQNVKDIALTLGITMDGIVREEMRSVGIYKHQTQYLASPGFASSKLNGMLCYNFCLNTSPFVLQPSGAMNVSKYSKIELEYTTIAPVIDPNASFLQICDPELNTALGTVKTAAQMYDYTFNLLVIEERYNILTFMGGNAGLMNAR